MVSTYTSAALPWSFSSQIDLIWPAVESTEEGENAEAFEAFEMMEKDLLLPTSPFW